MAESYIKMPDDAANTGKKMRHVENTVSGNLVQQQTITLANSDGTLPDANGGLLVKQVASNFLDSAAVRDVNATPQSVGGTALKMLCITNNQGAAAYLQFFVDNATPTLGTTSPDLEIMVAANSQRDVPLPPEGWPCGTTLHVVSTTASKGNTGSAAGVHVYTAYIA